MLKFLLLFLFSAFWAVFAGAEEITVPTLFSGSKKSFHQRLVKPNVKRFCQVALSGKSSAISKSILGLTGFEDKHQKQVYQTILAANRQFLRRGWSSEFMKERLRLAQVFDDQSEYINLYRKNLGIVATLGWTFAEYTSDYLPDPNLPAVVNRDRTQILPEEDCLHITPLERPTGKDGRGIILELRTWSIAKDRLKQDERAEAFGSMISQSYSRIIQKLSLYPELYDEPIIHLYADEKSLMLYGRMGFKATHFAPIAHPHTNEFWWDMAISPRDYEKLILRMKTPAFLLGFNQDIELAFGDQKISVPRGAVFERHDLSRVQIPGVQLHEYNSVGLLPGAVIVQKETSTLRRVVADKGASVGWFPSGKIAYVTSLAEPFPFHDGSGRPMLADVGSSIRWHENGLVAAVSKIATDAKVGEPEIVVAKGGSVSWGEDGIYLLSVVPLLHATEIAPGLVAASGAAIQWFALAQTEVPEMISSIVGKTTLEDGTVAADGAIMGWSPEWRIEKNGQRKFLRMRWSFISELAEPKEFNDGTVAPAGSQVQFLRFDQPPKINQPVL